MKKYLIYKTTNKINNMIYIGCHITNNINDGYLGSGTYFKRAVSKYGKEYFEREILFECSTDEEMYEKEAEIVNEAFISRFDTYNLALGGKCGSWYYANQNGLNNSAGQCEAHHLKLKEDEEYRKWYCEKVSIGRREFIKNNPENPNGWVGRRHTKESKKKIGVITSKAQKGSGNSQYGTMWITNELENKKVPKDSDIPDGFRKGRVIKKRI